MNTTKTPKRVMMIFIPGNVPSSKNSKQWTGKMLISSKATRDYIKSSEGYWLANKRKFKQMIQDKEKPYRIKFTFIRKTKHRFDYINPLETVQDLMTKYNWIEDDNADVIIPSFGEYKYDKNNPGVIIEVL